MRAKNHCSFCMPIIQGAALGALIPPCSEGQLRIITATNKNPFNMAPIHLYSHTFCGLLVTGSTGFHCQQVASRLPAGCTHHAGYLIKIIWPLLFKHFEVTSFSIFRPFLTCLIKCLSKKRDVNAT